MIKEKKDTNYDLVEGTTKTKLRDRFEKKCLAVNKYANILDVKPPQITQVLDGRTNGKKSKPDSATRKIIARLKTDGIWIGKLPWER